MCCFGPLQRFSNICGGERTKEGVSFQSFRGGSPGTLLNARQCTEDNSDPNSAEVEAIRVQRSVVQLEKCIPAKYLGWQKEG